MDSLAVMAVSIVDSMGPRWTARLTQVELLSANSFRNFEDSNTSTARAVRRVKEKYGNRSKLQNQRFLNKHCDFTP